MLGREPCDAPDDLIHQPAIGPHAGGPVIAGLEPAADFRHALRQGGFVHLQQRGAAGDQVVDRQHVFGQRRRNGGGIEQRGPVRHPAPGHHQTV